MILLISNDAVPTCSIAMLKYKKVRFWNGRNSALDRPRLIGP